jgi:hypothetical protein
MRAGNRFDQPVRTQDGQLARECRRVSPAEYNTLQGAAPVNRSEVVPNEDTLTRATPLFDSLLVGAEPRCEVARPDECAAPLAGSRNSGARSRRAASGGHRQLASVPSGDVRTDAQQNPQQSERFLWRPGARGCNENRGRHDVAQGAHHLDDTAVSDTMREPATGCATVAQLAEQRFCNRPAVASIRSESSLFLSILPSILPRGTRK